jgi:hypothetical protein
MSPSGIGTAGVGGATAACAWPVGLAARARFGSKHGSVYLIKPSSVQFHGWRPFVPRSSPVMIAHSVSTIVSLSLANLQKFVGSLILNSSNGRCRFSLCVSQCGQ